jgi:hypothetical protein
MGSERRIVNNADLTGMRPTMRPFITSGSQHGAYPVLASNRVRLVGGAVAAKRSAEDLADEAVFDIDGLPTLPSVEATLPPDSLAPHQGWPHNRFGERSRTRSAKPVSPICLLSSAVRSPIARLFSHSPQR